MLNLQLGLKQRKPPRSKFCFHMEPHFCSSEAKAEGSSSFGSVSSWVTISQSLMSMSYLLVSVFVLIESVPKYFNVNEALSHRFNLIGMVGELSYCPCSAGFELSARMQPTVPFLHLPWELGY